MKNLETYLESFRMKQESFLTGCDAMEEMGLWDRENLGEMEAFYANDMISVILRLIATDGKITDKEAVYLNETFGFDYTAEELAQVYESCAENIGGSFEESFAKGIALMEQLNEKLADAYRALLGLACRIMIESDGVIAETELAEAKRLADLWEECV